MSTINYSLQLCNLTQPPPPRPTLSPYTTLFRSVEHHAQAVHIAAAIDLVRLAARLLRRHVGRRAQHLTFDGHGDLARDRKSTRLNSSHVEISYAVFCLKKKKKLSLIIKTQVISI